MHRRLAPAAASLAALCLAAGHAAARPGAGGRGQDRPVPPRAPAPAPSPAPGGPAKSSDPADGPFRAGEVTGKAVITSKIEPGFTEEARRNDTYGIVRLRAILSKTGEVTDISVIKGLPDGLTEKAIAAARGIKFRPAQKDGRAVSQWVTLEYVFHIIDDEEKVESRAVILKQPAPEYTEEARRHGTEGTVVLEVTFYRDGTVAPVVVEGLPHGLSERALDAARRIEFRPAMDKGKPVTVVRRVEYVFRLD